MAKSNAYKTLTYAIAILLLISYENWQIISPSLENDNCAMIPQNQTSFNLKSNYGWHWGFTDGLIRFEQKCPSLMKNIAVYKGDMLIAQGKRPFLSLTDSIKVYDCFNQHLYTITTGHFGISLLNANSIFVSLLLQDRDGNVLSYIKSSKWFRLSTSHTIMNANGDVIARASKQIWSNSINVNILKPTDPGANMLPLGIAFSLSQFTSTRSTDFCNIIYTYCGIAVAVAFLFFGLFMNVYFGSRLSSRSNVFGSSSFASGSRGQRNGVRDNNIPASNLSRV
jgi:hypothetical protein